MDDLRSLFIETPDLALMISGLVIGLVFGAVVLRTNFCTMGGISDMVTFNDTRRFKAWLLAIAVAMVGTQALAYAGVIDIERSMYVGESFTWMGNLLGGLLFGVGMVFAGGCASRNVARVGSGDLRAVFTLIVMGLFAYMAVGGIFAVARLNTQQWMSVDMPGLGQTSTGLGAAFGKLIGADAATGGLALASALGLAVLVICFTDARFRTSANNIASGILIGLCIVAGWLATNLAYDEFADKLVPSGSLTFVRPTGDLLDWLQRATASGLPKFGVMVIVGGILGAFVVALATGRFRLQTFADTSDTIRTLTGAALMGVGGVTALGCTVGQGLTGLSTLAVGSFVTFAAIVVGGIIGIRALEYQMMRQAEAA